VTCPTGRCRKHARCPDCLSTVKLALNVHRPLISAVDAGKVTVEEFRRLVELPPDRRQQA
jgi:hypothetical protein